MYVALRNVGTSAPFRSMIQPPAISCRFGSFAGSFAAACGVDTVSSAIVLLLASLFVFQHAILGLFARGAPVTVLAGLDQEIRAPAEDDKEHQVRQKNAGPRVIDCRSHCRHLS